MPNAPLRPCAEPQCSALVPRGRCATHARAKDTHRGTAQERGYDYRWSVISKLHRQQYQLCGMRAENAYDGWRGECYEQGRTTLATCTDHIIPFKGDYVLKVDPRNRQSMCQNCNRIKGIRYEGGFGR